MVYTSQVNSRVVYTSQVNPGWYGATPKVYPGSMVLHLRYTRVVYASQEGIPGRYMPLRKVYPGVQRWVGGIPGCTTVGRRYTLGMRDVHHGRYTLGV